MSEGERDARLLQQVDHRLERGTPSEDPVVNALASTVPQAEAGFRDALEQRLMAHYTAQTFEKEAIDMQLTTARAPQRGTSLSALPWLAAVLGVVLLGGALLALDQRGRMEPSLFATQITADEPAQTIVIATRNILAGDTITEEMVGLITVSAADYAKLQSAEPERAFFSDLADVVGQRTTTAMFWFEPVSPVKLGQVPARCGADVVTCVTEPEGTYTISFPGPMIPAAGQGLVAGDRVDVLASADNTLSVIVEDVLLVGIGDGEVVLAAPSWQHSVLVWLWQSEQPYMLRPTTISEAAPLDDSLVETTFTSQEPLPDNYQFDLIVEVEVSQGFRLADAPASLDGIQYTQRDTIMNFWFTDIERMNLTEPTEVVVRLPQADAVALEFLLSQPGVGMTFNPDAGV